MQKKTAKTARKVKKVADLTLGAAKAARTKGGINFRETGDTGVKQNAPKVTIKFNPGPGG